MELGCNAIKYAIANRRLGYLDVFNSPTDEALQKRVLTFYDGFDPEGTELPVLCLNFCPFCGTAFKDNLPQCEGRIGEISRASGYVDLKPHAPQSVE